MSSPRVPRISRKYTGFSPGTSIPIPPSRYVKKDISMEANSSTSSNPAAQWEWNALPKEFCTRRNETIHVAFPRRHALPCTENLCKKVIASISWEATTFAFAHHLAIDHNIFVKEFHTWCQLCKTRFRAGHAQHSCLNRARKILPFSVPTDTRICCFMCHEDFGKRPLCMAHIAKMHGSERSPSSLYYNKDWALGERGNLQYVQNLIQKRINTASTSDQPGHSELIPEYNCEGEGPSQDALSTATEDEIMNTSEISCVDFSITEEVGQSIRADIAKSSPESSGVNEQKTASSCHGLDLELGIPTTPGATHEVTSDLRPLNDQSDIVDSQLTPVSGGPKASTPVVSHARQLRQQISLPSIVDSTIGSGSSLNISEGCLVQLGNHVQRVDNRLHIGFPRPAQITCTVSGCNELLKGLNWAFTTHVIVRHYRDAHGIGLEKLCYWCTICSKRFYSRPERHPCQGRVPLLQDPMADGLYNCATCNHKSSTAAKIKKHQQKRHGFGKNMIAIGEHEDGTRDVTPVDGEMNPDFSTTEFIFSELALGNPRVPHQQSTLMQQQSSSRLPTIDENSDGGIDIGMSPVANQRQQTIEPLCEQVTTTPAEEVIIHKNPTDRGEDFPIPSTAEMLRVIMDDASDINMRVVGPTPPAGNTSYMPKETVILSPDPQELDDVMEEVINEDVTSHIERRAVLPSVSQPQDPTSVRRSPTNGPNSHSRSTAHQAGPVPCWEELKKKFTHRDVDVLHFVFPCASHLVCTERGCKFTSSATSWSISQSSLKKHLQTAHSRDIRSTLKWCRICKSQIGKHVGRHNCFKDVEFVYQVNQGWPCDRCTYYATTKIGLGTHKKSHLHNVNTAADREIQLPRPDTNARRRRTNGNHQPQSPVEPDSLPTRTIHQNVTPLSAAAPPDTAAHSIQRTFFPAHHMIPPREDPGESAHVDDGGTQASGTQPSAPLEHMADPDGGEEDDTERGYWPNWIPKPTDDLAGIPALTAEYRDRLIEILHRTQSASTWNQFEALVDKITGAVRTSAKVNTQGNPQNRSPPPVLDVTDAKKVQRSYTKNRKKTLRAVREEPASSCPIAKAAIFEHFKRIAPTQQCDTSLYNRVSPEVREIHTTPFLEVEVLEKLQSAENTAPGPDKVTYTHWRHADPEAAILTIVFNICLRYLKIPASWKTSTTVLLPKAGDPTDIANWRPIALSSTMYKLFAKCIASRLSKWVSRENRLSRCQKGFLPHDGVFEHNYVMEERILKAKNEKKDIFLAFLDIKNAFGAVPHEAILKALLSAGAGPGFTQLIEEIYTGTTTQVLTKDGLTEVIKMESGVKQGCPLSGILFDIAIDAILQEIQGDDDEHKALAFADDIGLLADSADELQNAMDKVESLGRKINLLLKPAKCRTLHISGRTPVGSRPTEFTLGGTVLHKLGDGDSHKFLGKPVGFDFQTENVLLDDFMADAIKITRSTLAPWQKIDALKAFVYPRLQFPMRMGIVSKVGWTKFDRVVRAELKKILNLPDFASNEYLYGAREAGCLGIPDAATDSDIYKVDGAFKLLTSRDFAICKMALDDLVATVKETTLETPSMTEVSQYLSGSNDGALHMITGRRANVWSRARVASKRLGILWDIDSTGKPQLKIGESFLYSNQRATVLKRTRSWIRSRLVQQLCLKKSQGKTIDCVGLSPASTHFLTTGKYMRFAEWRFVHRARLNVLPVRANNHWNRTVDKNCRRCKSQLETLPHILNHCMRESTAMKNRHNSVHMRVRTMALKEWGILYEDELVPDTRCYPDLVLVKGDTAVILDFTCPFENNKKAFSDAREEKRRKYQPVEDLLRKTYKVVHNDAICVGALGTWDNKNDRILKILCTNKRYLRTLRNLCVSEVLRWSRDIYVEFMTGVRQYEEDIVIPRRTNGPPRTQQRRNLANTSNRRRPQVSPELSIHRLIQDVRSETIGSTQPESITQQRSDRTEPPTRRLPDSPEDVGETRTRLTETVTSHVQRQDTVTSVDEHTNSRPTVLSSMRHTPSVSGNVPHGSGDDWEPAIRPRPGMDMSDVPSSMRHGLWSTTEPRRNRQTAEQSGTPETATPPVHPHSQHSTVLSSMRHIPNVGGSVPHVSGEDGDTNAPTRTAIRVSGAATSAPAAETSSEALFRRSKDDLVPSSDREADTPATWSDHHQLTVLSSMRHLPGVRGVVPQGSDKGRNVAGGTIATTTTCEEPRSLQDNHSDADDPDNKEKEDRSPEDQEIVTR